MYVRLDTQPLQSVAEQVGGMLTVIVSDNDTADHEVAALELVTQSEDVLVIGDAQVGTHLVLLDVVGRHHDDDFQLVAQLGKHPELWVGLEAGQHTAGMMVVEQLSA